MTKTTNQKAQASGCGGCLSLILLGFIILGVRNCAITHTGPISGKDAAVLQREAEQIRAHLQAGDCDRLYQDFFQAFHAELSSEEFAETCDGMSAKYQAVASVTLASTQCEITRYPFKGEEYGNCTISYRLSLNDGVTAQEIHEWYLENGEYYWVDLYWPEEQAEN